MRLYRVGDKVKIKAQNRKNFTGVIINDRSQTVLGPKGKVVNSYIVQLNESNEIMDFKESDLRLG